MNVISQRRVAGSVVVAVAALLAVLVVGTLLEAWESPAVAPSASTEPTATSPAATISPPSPDGSAAGSLMPGESGPSPIAPPSSGAAPTLVLPSRQPGDDGPEPTIHIPPPIR